MIDYSHSVIWIFVVKNTLDIVAAGLFELCYGARSGGEDSMRQKPRSGIQTGSMK